jgi:hypothetical protein
MAVTKTIDIPRIKAAISCGVDLLGENRVQEFLEKRAEYSGSCEIHFIGGLQTNKVRPLFREFSRVDMIHSVGSEKLAREINFQARQKDDESPMDILIQVNIGGEATKNGVAPEELDALVEVIDRLTAVRLRGLMAIPPFGDSVRYFPKMQRLFEGLKSRISTADTLSMGMSGDYEEAVMHGATIVRLGTALFGSR